MEKLRATSPSSSRAAVSGKVVTSPERVRADSLARRRRDRRSASHAAKARIAPTTMALVASVKLSMCVRARSRRRIQRLARLRHLEPADDHGPVAVVDRTRRLERQALVRPVDEAPVEAREDRGLADRARPAAPARPRAPAPARPGSRPRASVRAARTARDNCEFRGRHDQASDGVQVIGAQRAVAHRGAAPRASRSSISTPKPLPIIDSGTRTSTR